MLFPALIGIGRRRPVSDRNSLLDRQSIERVVLSVKKKRRQFGRAWVITLTGGTERQKDILIFDALFFRTYLLKHQYTLRQPDGQNKPFTVLMGGASASLP